VQDFLRLVAATPVGGKLQLTIVRSERQQTIEATIEEMLQRISSAQSKVAAPNAGSAATAFGIELLPLDAPLRKEPKVPKDVNGECRQSRKRRHGDRIWHSAGRCFRIGPRNVLLLINRHRASRFVGFSVDKNGTSDSSR